MVEIKRLQLGKKGLKGKNLLGDWGGGAVGGLGVSAKNSGTVKFDKREASGGVPVCVHVRESLGNRRRDHR